MLVSAWYVTRDPNSGRSKHDRKSLAARSKAISMARYRELAAQQQAIRAERESQRSAASPSFLDSLGDAPAEKDKGIDWLDATPASRGDSEPYLEAGCLQKQAREQQDRRKRVARRDAILPVVAVGVGAALGAILDTAFAGATLGAMLAGVLAGMFGTFLAAALGALTAWYYVSFLDSARFFGQGDQPPASPRISSARIVASRAAVVLAAVLSTLLAGMAGRPTLRRFALLIAGEILCLVLLWLVRYAWGDNASDKLPDP